jgi:hypothetical protein
VKEIDQLHGGEDSIYSLMLQGSKAGVLLGEGNMEEAYTLCQELIPKIIKYYDGNETNEMIIDPLIVLGSI